MEDLTNNTLYEEGKKKYKNIMFTDKGYETLMTFTQTLAKEYHKKKKEEYPFKLGRVFGIPLFHYAHTINSQDELYGRLKAYGQILGIKEIVLDMNNTQIIINLGDK